MPVRSSDNLVQNKVEQFIIPHPPKAMMKE